jgi:cellulose synthase/poly-beta-1,6-N-acetylglucosamine synthase-like glycosyltransferase
MSEKHTISVVIPAHNEEAMIANCIDSCLQQTRKPDQILVINDGSTDGTEQILKRYGAAITYVTIPVATGNKSHAQQFGLQFVTGDIFIATDGDTILHSQFVEYVERAFNDNPDIGSVAGYVRSTTHNWLTALREIDYVIGQDIYKKAQSYVDYILVIPGCAGAFKTELFHNGVITFDHDTVTEDLDFTYKLHKNTIRICFEPRAIVYTQDPDTLHSYTNQMRRWYGGGWQNLLKHYDVVTRSPGGALQLSLTYLESAMFALFFFLLPLINVVVFVQLSVLALAVSVVVGGYAALRRNRIDLLLFSPLMLPLRALNAWVFLEQFILEVIIRRRTMTWFQPERRRESFTTNVQQS